MVKRVFAIIGIVFGCVAAFVGVVAGVMAAMGKFKTPDVYPTVLNFAISEEVVIEQIPYSESTKQTATLYSFVLSGYNPDETEFEVNKKDCYIWFKNGESAKLITLCDAYRNPLVKDKNNRYLVKCNEPIYYMVNEVADDFQTDGKVELVARSTNDTLKKPNNNKTIWIDRKVESVFVNYGADRDLVKQTQSITVGVDIPFNFDYIVNTPLSLKPMAQESAKDIELYYNVEGMGFGTDYLRVTADTIINEPLNSILTYEEVLTFKQSDGLRKQHTFYIATYRTYQDEQDYKNMIGEEFVENPNHHKLTTTNPRTNETFMTVTTLTVNVEDIAISEVGFNGTGVVLNLYSKNDYVTLNGTSGVAGAKDNNLGLYMKKDSIEDTTRFDEVTMSGFAGDVFTDKVALFQTITNGSGDEVWEESVAENNINSTVTLTENLKLINYLEKDGKKYYCTNGVAVYDTNEKTVKVLKSGSYLNFYVHENIASQDTYTLKTFNYEVKSFGAGANKTWNIISKEIPELKATQKLCLGILVVNAEGNFVLGNFFDTVTVSLNTVDLNREIKKQSESFNITFAVPDAVNVDGIVCPEGIPFDEFIQINSGSYDACVFFVKQKIDESGATPVDITMVDTISNIKYIKDGVTYVLVGYVDGGEFVNSVRVNKNVTKDNKECELYMMQFKNAFEVDAEMFVKDYLTTGLEINESNATNLDKIVDWHTNKPIQISAKYQFNMDLISVTFNGKNITELPEGKYFEVYENTSGHEVVLSSTNENMWGIIQDFYSLSKENVQTNYSSNLLVAEFKPEDTSRVVVLEAEKCLSYENTPILISLNVGDKQYYVCSFNVLSASPDQIVFKAGGQQMELSTNPEDALASNSYLKIKVLYDSDTKNINYDFFMYVEGQEQRVAYPFNYDTSDPDYDGFYDKEDKGQSLDVIYNSSNKSVLNSERVHTIYKLVEQSGEAVLSVTIGDTTQYVKVVTEANDFELNLVNGSTVETNKTEMYLKELFKFTYKTEELTVSRDYSVYITSVESVRYGDGTLTLENDSDDYVLKDKNSNTILLITHNSNGWKFVKSNVYIPLTISFEVQTFVGENIKIRLTFASSVAVGINSIWIENKTLYAGTNVKLYNTDADNADYAVFKITMQAGVVGTVGFALNGTAIATNDYVFEVEDKHIGNIIIQVLFDGVKIAEFEFKVLPNVVAKVNSDVFATETYYGLSEVYATLAAFDGSITYGSNATSLYTTDENDDGVFDYLTETPTNLSLTVSSEGNADGLVAIDGVDLKINAMQELNVQVERTINLIYSYTVAPIDKTYIVSTDVIKIENCKEVDFVHTGEELAVGVKSSTYKAGKPYASFATVSGFNLTSITAENLEFEVSSGEFKLKTILTTELENVEVTLTFDDKESPEDADYQTLTYKTNITLVPYTPEITGTEEIAHSETSYDLFGSFYGNAILNDGNVNKLFVTKLLDENGNDISTQIAPNFVAGGYTKGVADPKCEVTFSKIYCASKNIKVQFTITYTNNETYVYELPLTIDNRQEITVTYPENIEKDNITFKFLDGYTADGCELSGEQANATNSYNVAEFKFEPVAVYSNKTVTLDFDEDALKNVKRADVTTYKGSADKGLTIELIAYQNTQGMAEFCSRFQNTNATNQITLPYAENSLFGNLIFKLTTVSGYHAYYFVYIFSVGDTLNNVDISNNVDVIVGVQSIYAGDYVSVNSGSTYTNIINKINFADKFKIDTNGLELYLYNVELTGGSETFSKGEKIDVTTTISQSSLYKTMKIGLVKNVGYTIYTFGTITIYVQPTTSVSVNAGTEIVTNSWQYEKPNGVFTATVKASATEIASPFGTNWTATIDSQTKADGTATNYSFTSSSSKVKLDERVPEDVYIKVKYTYSNTIIYVTYKYLATTIPDQDETVVTTVGQFVDETTGFNRTINLIGENNKENFFGTYVGDYKIYIGDTELTAVGQIGNVGRVKTPTTDDLTFNLTTEQQEIDIQISYTNFGGETRIFKFIVLPGLYYDKSSTADDSGLTSSSKVSTIFKNYNSNVGSTLGITKVDPVANNGFTKYQIGELKIYTYSADISNVSSLELTFERNQVDENALADYQYVLEKDNTNKYNVLTSKTTSLTRNSSGEIYFVHTPVTRYVVMTIKVKDSSDYEYSELANLHINIVKTYNDIKAEYLTENATHENVSSKVYEDPADPTSDLISNNIPNLHTYFFDDYDAGVGSKFRYSLIKTDDTTESVNLNTMGFNDTQNPNYINFAVAGNAILSNAGTTLTFNDVTLNTMCPVTLTNKAGLISNENNVYNFQIVPGINVDGIDFSSRNGYYGEYDLEGVMHQYISYMMKDNYSTYINDNHAAVDADRPFVIGTMKDLRNNSVFTLNLFKVDGASDISNSSVTTKKKIVEGKYDGDAVSRVVGGYTNGVQYEVKYPSATNPTHIFYITFNTDNKLVELIVNRTSGTKQDLEITISLGGVSGANTILNEFTLFLSKDQIKENYGSSIDNSVYANDLVDLFKDGDADGIADGIYDDGKFIENGGVDSPELIYELAESSYTLGGIEYKITDNDNELFKYDVDNRRIQTKPVGEAISAIINFTVKSGNYVLKTVTYRVAINLNLQIVVQDNSIEVGANHQETNFVLSTKEGATVGKVADGSPNLFPIKVEFKELLDTNTNKNGDIYDVLAYRLYQISDNKKLGWNNVNVNVKTRSDSFSVITDNGKVIGIEFVKDYTGYIEIELYVETDNGRYSIDWIVSVTGVLSLEHISGNNASTTKLTNNAQPYNSKQEVSLITNTKSTTNSDVYISKPSKFASSYRGGKVTVNAGDSIVGYYYSYNDNGVTKYAEISDINAKASNNLTDNYYKNNIYIGKKITYQYAIIPNNETTQAMTNEALFNYTTGHVALGSVTTTGIYDSFKVILPSVPATSLDANSKSYFVTYKFYVEYLGLEYSDTPANNEVKVFYVTYNVVNYQTVSENETSVDVSKITTSPYNLDLLYYEDIYTDSVDNKYSFTYNGTSLQLSVITSENNSYTIVSSDNKTFVNGTDKYEYTNEGGKLIKLNGAPLAGGNWSQVKKIDNVKDAGGNVTTLGTVLSAGFSDIFEFKAFIDTYLNIDGGVTLTKDGTTHEFKLVSTGNGKFGIALSENVATEGKLFNNDMKAELAFVDNGVKTVTINPYSEENTKGFRLYVPNSITAKYSKTLSEMFLSSYFEKNDAIANNPVSISTSIIGLGTDYNSWVNNGTKTAISSSSYATINIPKDHNGGVATYNVKKVTYTGTGGGTYYSVTQDFYYIEESQVIIPDYSTGIAEYYFKVQYGQSLDLSDAVQVWKTVITGEKLEIKKDNFDGELSASVIKQVRVTHDESDNEIVKVDASNLIISIDKDDLDAYKLTCPHKKTYPIFNVVIKAGETTTLACEVEFNLYNYVQVNKLAESGSEIKHNGTNDITINLTGQVAIAISGTNNFETLTSTNLTSVTDVVENGYSGYLKVYSEGKLTLDGNEINEYFTTTSEETLKVVFTISTTYGAVDFEVTIKKS